MKLTVAENHKEMSEVAADYVVGQVKQKPASSFMLPTGETAKLMHKKIVRKSGGKGFANASFFQLDDIWFNGKKRTKEREKASYASYLKKRLLEKTDFREKNAHLFDSFSEKPERVCAHHEKEAQKNGIDLAVLGLGSNGHIAFNEPGSSKNSKTRIAELKKETQKVKSKGSLKPDKVFTVGLKTIMRAKKIVVIASGGKKARAVSAAIKKKPFEKWPVSILNAHKKSEMLVDKKAAALLEHKQQCTARNSFI